MAHTGGMVMKGRRGGSRKSLRNPVTYDALRREGMSKSKAARISNGILKRGVRKGRRSREG